MTYGITIEPSPEELRLTAERKALERAERDRIEAWRAENLAKVERQREETSARERAEAERPVRAVAAMLHSALGSKVGEFLQATATMSFAQLREILEERWRREAQAARVAA